jgi:hypothetical protein
VRELAPPLFNKHTKKEDIFDLSKTGWNSRQTYINERESLPKMNTSLRNGCAIPLKELVLLHGFHQVTKR